MLTKVEGESVIILVDITTNMDLAQACLIAGLNVTKNVSF